MFQNLYLAFDRNLGGQGRLLSMLRALLLGSSILSVFIVAWCLGRASGPPNCMQSEIVTGITIGTKGFGRCSWGDRYFGELPAQALNDNRVIERIDKLGHFYSQITDETSDLQVRVIDDPKSAILWEKNLVQISIADLVHPGRLERAILAAQLFISSELMAEVLADFLWQVSESEFGAKSGPWFHTLAELNGYCSSDDQLLIHEEFCKTHAEYMGTFITNAPRGPMAWSFKSLYTSILMNIYRDLDWKSRRMMLGRLLFLGEPADEFISETQSLRVKFVDFETAKNQLLRQWLMPLDLPESAIERYLSLSDSKTLGPLTYIVVGRSARNVFPVELWKLNNASRKGVVIESGSVKHFPPSDVAYTISRNEIKKRFNIDRVIYVSCSMPTPESLLSYEILTERVVYLRLCEDGDLRWQDIIDSGMDSYLVQNPDVEFAEFNLSALRLASRLRGNLQDPASIGSWSRWLIWQDQLDEIGDIRRPLAVIEGVRRYRFQNSVEL